MRHRDRLQESSKSLARRFVLIANWAGFVQSVHQNGLPGSLDARVASESSGVGPLKVVKTQSCRNKQSARRTVIGTRLQKGGADRWDCLEFSLLAVVFKILMVHPNKKGYLGYLQPMAPLLQGQLDCQ